MISKIDRDPQELTDLVLDYQRTKDPAILDKICDKSYGLIRKVSNSIYPHLRSQDRREFFQDGCLCLVSSAVQNYDLKKGHKFEKYLGWRVFGAIGDGLRRRDPMSRTLRQGISQLNETLGIYETVNGKKRFTVEELVELTGKPREVVIATLRLDEGKIVSLSGPPKGSDRSLDTVLGFPNDPSVTAIQHEFSEMAYRFMEERLPQKISEAIHLRYLENYGLKEIAEIQGVTKSRVSKSISEGIDKMRIFFSGKMGNGPRDECHSAA
jgi:RNA polymerase sigma factor FliA